MEKSDAQIQASKEGRRRNNRGLKKINSTVEQHCIQNPEKKVRLFFQDEAGFGRINKPKYYRARLYIPDDAIELLQEMRRYLRKHPSAYYLSAYHRAMGVILHNANRDLKTILHHEDRAIAAARLSSHPEAKKQLAACLMNKARTLMSEEMDQKQVRKLIQEAGPIVSRYTEPRDYERYQYDCNAAMCFAMDGDLDDAQVALDAADAIIWLVLSLILIVIAVVLMLSAGTESMPGWAGGFLFLFYACAPIIGGGGYLVFKWLPEKENEKIIEKQGGIRFPNGLTPFTDKKYYAIEDSLRSTGFTNISCVNLHDLNLLTALVNADKIAKITINGQQVTSGGKMYMPDVPVVITYHGR